MPSATLAAFEQKAAILLEAYTTGSAEAMARLYEHTWHRRSWPTFRNYVQLDLGRRPIGPDDTVPITLDDARYLVAREHGFESWPALAAHLAAPPTRARADAGIAVKGQLTDETLGHVHDDETMTTLDLSGSKRITDAGVIHLRGLPALAHLDLSGTQVTDAGLGVLRDLPALTHLSLAWTRVSDEGLRVLGGCTRLQHLNLAGTAAGGGALRALAGLPALRHLEIALGDAEMALLANLPRFAQESGMDDSAATWSVFGVTGAPTHLSLRGRFTDRGLAALSRLDGLYSLDIDDARLPITAAGLEALTALPHLTALRVDAKDDDSMAVIAGLPRLRFLAAQDTTAGDDGFVALSRSATLEYVWGRRCHNLTRPGFQALAGMPSLKGLSVSCLKVDDTGLSALPRFPSLVELMPMDVPDEGFRHVGRCPRLASLILMYCRDTTDRATEHITGLPLSYYFNSYTVITDRTPALLSHIPSLERVTFDTCHNLTDSGVAALARLPRLRELRVSGRGVTAAVGRAFDSSVAVHVE